MHTIIRYQIVDYRIGSRVIGRNVPIPIKQAHRYSIPVLRRTAPGPITVDLARGSTHDDEIEDKPDDDLPYVFTSNKLPVQKQVFYQLCDIHVAEVQKLISANDGQVGVTMVTLLTWPYLIGEYECKCECCSIEY